MLFCFMVGCLLSYRLHLITLQLLIMLMLKVMLLYILGFWLIFCSTRAGQEDSWASQSHLYVFCGEMGFLACQGLIVEGRQGLIGEGRLPSGNSKVVLCCVFLAGKLVNQALASLHPATSQWLKWQSTITPSCYLLSVANCPLLLSIGCC